MYCKQCGRKLLDEARFCPDCGRSVELTQARKPSAEKVKPIKRWLLVAAGVAVIGIALLIILSSPAIKVKGLLDKAQTCMDTGSFEDAIGLYEQVLLLDSENTTAREGIERADTAMKTRDAVPDVTNDAPVVQQNKADYESVYTAFINKELLPKYGQSNANAVVFSNDIDTDDENEMIAFTDTAVGIVQTHIADMDGDGISELIAIRADGGERGYYYDPNLYIHIYTYENGEVASITEPNGMYIASPGISCVEMAMYIAYIETEEGRYVLVNNFHGSDGFSDYFDMYSLKGKQVVQCLDMQYGDDRFNGSTAWVSLTKGPPELMKKWRLFEGDRPDIGNSFVVYYEEVNWEDSSGKRAFQLDDLYPTREVETSLYYITDDILGMFGIVPIRGEGTYDRMNALRSKNGMEAVVLFQSPIPFGNEQNADIKDSVDLIGETNQNTMHDDMAIQRLAVCVAPIGTLSKTSKLTNEQCVLLLRYMLVHTNMFDDDPRIVRDESRGITCVSDAVADEYVRKVFGVRFVDLGKCSVDNEDWLDESEQTAFREDGMYCFGNYAWNCADGLDHRNCELKSVVDNPDGTITITAVRENSPSNDDCCMVLKPVNAEFSYQIVAIEENTW